MNLGLTNVSLLNAFSTVLNYSQAIKKSSLISHQFISSKLMHAVSFYNFNLISDFQQKMLHAPVLLNYICSGKFTGGAFFKKHFYTLLNFCSDSTLQLFLGSISLHLDTTYHDLLPLDNLFINHLRTMTLLFKIPHLLKKSKEVCQKLLAYVRYSS